MTTETLEHYGPWAFPIFFIGLWLFVTTFLGVLSGWYGLMMRFPNRQERPTLRLNNQYGSMGIGVQMNGILVLSVCPSGLRVGMWRLFGLFSRDFFVPWSEITVARRNRIFWKSAKLTFGRPGSGHLILMEHIANRLAHAAGPLWPESGTFLPETAAQAFRRIFVQWLLVTTLASLFYITASSSAGQAATPEWIAICVGFPATVFGIFSVFRFFASIAPGRTYK